MGYRGHPVKGPLCSFPAYETQNPGEQDCSDYSDEDGVDQTAAPCMSKRLHDEATDNSADDADDDVTEGPVTAALHELTGEKPGDKSHQDPPD